MRFEIFTLKWETEKIWYWRTKFTLFRIFRRWATHDQIFTIVKCLTSISRLTERWVSVSRCNVCWESSSRWSATRTEKPISRKKKKVSVRKAEEKRKEYQFRHTKTRKRVSIFCFTLRSFVVRCNKWTKKKWKTHTTRLIHRPHVWMR